MDKLERVEMQRIDGESSLNEKKARKLEIVPQEEVENASFLDVRNQDINLLKKHNARLDALIQELLEKYAFYLPKRFQNEVPLSFFIPSLSKEALWEAYQTRINLVSTIIQSVRKENGILKATISYLENLQEHLQICKEVVKEDLPKAVATLYSAYDAEKGYLSFEERYQYQQDFGVLKEVIDKMAKQKDHFQSFPLFSFPDEMIKDFDYCRRDDQFFVKYQLKNGTFYCAIVETNRLLLKRVNEILERGSMPQAHINAYPERVIEDAKTYYQMKEYTCFFKQLVSRRTNEKARSEIPLYQSALSSLQNIVQKQIAGIHTKQCDMGMIFSTEDMKNMIYGKAYFEHFEEVYEATTEKRWQSEENKSFKVFEEKIEQLSKKITETNHFYQGKQLSTAQLTALEVIEKRIRGAEAELNRNNEKVPIRKDDKILKNIAVMTTLTAWNANSAQAKKAWEQFLKTGNASAFLLPQEVATKIGSINRRACLSVLIEEGLREYLRWKEMPGYIEQHKTIQGEALEMIENYIVIENFNPTLFVEDVLSDPNKISFFLLSALVKEQEEIRGKTIKIKEQSTNPYALKVEKMIQQIKENLASNPQALGRYSTDLSITTKYNHQI